MYRILFVLFLLTTCLIAEAGHLVGGEISYYQVGGDTYVINLRMYRDCNASGPLVITKFDSAVNISIYDASNNELISVVNIVKPPDSTRLPLVLAIPCLPNPPDICILEMVYTDTIIIDIPPNGVHLVNQRCCRTPSSLNIVNPSQYGSTYSTYIPGSNLFTNNSSPQFNQVPPIALCVGIYLELDYSATDPDSDSLYFDLCTPFHGGGSGFSNGVPQPDTPAAPPFDTVAWSSGFNKGYQLSASPAFIIDHSKRLITGRPDQIGTYAFGVCVSEFRDGLKLSENKRDFQMEVTSCDVEAAAAIDSAVEECIGLQIQFYNKSTLGEYFYWDFGDLTTINDTSTSSNPIYTYPDTGFYTIRLIAIGETGCSDTSYFTYHVRPKIIPEFEVPAPQCFEGHSFDFKHAGHAKNSTYKYWVIQNDTLIIEPDQIGIFNQQFPNPGSHIVQLVYEDFGCVKIQSDTIGLFNKPTMSLVQPFRAMCSPFNQLYSVDTENAEKRSYQWFVDNTLVSIEENPMIIVQQFGLFDLRIRLTTDSLCKDTIEINYPDHIEVYKQPVANFTVNPVIADMFEPNFTLFDSSHNFSSSQFYLDSTILSSNEVVELELSDTGSYEVSLMAINDNGCRDTLVKSIRVAPRYLVYIPNSFTPNADGMNDLWFPKVFVSTDYYLSICDRWGHLVFESNNASRGWDGTGHLSGSDSPQGLYHYQIEATDLNDKAYQYTGTITLYR